jgi:hypothetical protein
MEWSSSRPDRFIPEERASGTHLIGGWVGPRAGLDTAVKRKIRSPSLELNPGRLARSLVIILSEIPSLSI